MPAQSSELIGRRLGGRFLIERCRIELPQGLVFDARDDNDGRQVAVNLLTGVPVPGPHFEREARRIRALHPSLVARVHGAFRLPDGTAGIVTAPMRGSSLADHVAEGPLSLSSTVRLLDALVQGLTACHMSGVVHRDLRPEQVWLEPREGRSPRIVLHGAGVPSLVGARHGKVGAFIFGDARFMAPEQWVDRAIDGRADMYGAAMLAYYALLGAPLVTGGSAVEICRNHFTTPRPKALDSVGNEPIPGTFLEALATATHPERSQRYNSIEAFQAALTTVRFSVT